MKGACLLIGISKALNLESSHRRGGGGEGEWCLGDGWMSRVPV